MRTFLACCGLDGDTQSLMCLRDLINQWRPDAVLFSGGLFSPPGSRETSTDDAERHQFELTLLDSFFSVLGGHASFAAVIPGPQDAPLRSFLRAGIYAQSQFPGLHIVHATQITSNDVVLAGVGGAITSGEDTGEPVVRCSRTTAEYFLQGFLLAEQSQKVLLFAAPPGSGREGQAGNPIVGELIDTCHPKLCVVGGTTALRNTWRVAHTTVVNPGRLADGCAALVDWSAGAENQVEMLQVAP